MSSVLTPRTWRLVVSALAVVLVGLLWATPASAAAKRSWAFAAMRVPAERPTGSGVRVAVVDSGIDAMHPAFAGRVTATADCVGSEGRAAACKAGGSDDNGHGTHIAGIVGARATGGAPEGVAPDVQLLAVRSLENTCEPQGADEQCRALGRLDDVVAGVRWATARGAHVINLSIDAGVGLDWRNGELADAVRDAWRAGTAVVASTGNRGATLDDGDLASMPLVLVGAVTASGDVASYSNLPGRARWGVLAPGGEAGGSCSDVGVVSTYPRMLEAAGTGCLSGTSMAAAYTSGALASLISAGIDTRAAVAQLLTTARSTDAGAVVDLGAALSAPPTPAAATTAADLAPARRGATAADGAVFSASIEQWTKTHPIRTRFAATGVVALGIVLVNVRRRNRPSLLGF